MKRDDLAEFDGTGDEFDAMMADSDQAEVTGPPAAARQVRFDVINRALLIESDGTTPTEGGVSSTST